MPPTFLQGIRQFFSNIFSNSIERSRYINDCIVPTGWNVRFDKHPEEKCAYVIALRDIELDEELFVDYGRWYWAGKKPIRLLK
jgi:hypothetical protein